MLHYCFYLKSSNLLKILSLRKGHFCHLLLAATKITALDGEKQKKPVKANLILIRKTEINKLLIMVCPLKPRGFSGAMNTE